MEMGSDVHTASILTVGLGGEVFAIPAGIVREILDVGRVTPVPTAPAFVCNLINVRGRVVPLANLRLRFRMPAVEPTRDTRIVVLEIDLEGVKHNGVRGFQNPYADRFLSREFIGIEVRGESDLVIVGRGNIWQPLCQGHQTGQRYEECSQESPA